MKRPWLAALLASLVAGLGHLYLRRWKRAIGWIILVVATTAIFLPSDIQTALNSGTIGIASLVPVFVVEVANVIDAYLLANVQNAMAQLPTSLDDISDPPRSDKTAPKLLTHCPHCGKELDSDLDFCQWCGTDVNVSQTGES
jgi:hypothetical protein